MTEQLTILYNKRSAKIYSALALLMIVICVAALYFIDFNEIDFGMRLFSLKGGMLNLNPYFTSLLFKISLWVMIPLSLTALVVTVQRARHSKVALVVSHDGLWVDAYGFIPWENIAQISEKTISGQSFVAIMIKNITPVKKQASWRGKISLIGSDSICLFQLEDDNKSVVRRVDHLYKKALSRSS